MNKGVATALTVTLFLAAWNLGAWHGKSEAHPFATGPVELAAPASPASSFEPSTLPLDETVPGPRRDLYDNDINDAVATYTHDRTGGMYEEHSPQTEVPRLAPPTT